MSGMKLPLDPLPRGTTVPVRKQPADLTARGRSLFPDLPAPSSSKDAPIVDTFDQSRICEGFIFPFAFTAAINLLVLPRQSAPRMGLLIVNTNIAAGIFYAFDGEANNVNGVPIVNGGNRLFDVAVPQGDLNIFSSGAGLVIIEYLLLSNY